MHKVYASKVGRLRQPYYGGKGMEAEGGTTWHLVGRCDTRAEAAELARALLLARAATAVYVEPPGEAEGDLADLAAVMGAAS